MKRFIALTFITALSISTASAAPKPITLQLGSVLPAVAAEGFTLSGSNSIFLQNGVNKSADIIVSAMNGAGVQQWQRVIDSTYDEVGGAITSDIAGNIWIAGSSAPTVAAETATSIAGIDNPDSVTVDAGNSLRPDMNLLTIWKLSPSGELVATYTAPQKSVPAISAISVNNSGLSIIGALDSRPFYISFTANVFGKLIFIGSEKTELNAVARNSDGSSFIYGSSAETLAGKKVAGIRDGVLIKISKSGAIDKVVRSSAVKAARSWVSGDSVNLVSGPVITGKVVETAITKFTPTFTPTWTLRMPSGGASVSLSANGNSYLAFTSKSAITGVAGWKPATPALIVITFDSKGVIKAATALPGLVKPLALQYSPSRGVVGLAAAGDGTVSIFTLVSR